MQILLLNFYIKNHTKKQMGRKKIAIDKIVDSKNRRLSFKKRRMSLLKKALQLAKLSGCSVYLKVFNHQD
jgi:hypothetical protein